MLNAISTPYLADANAKALYEQDILVEANLQKCIKEAKCAKHFES